MEAGFRAAVSVWAHERDQRHRHRQPEVLPDRHARDRNQRPLRVVERREASGPAEPVVEQPDLRVQQRERDQ